MNSNVRLLLVVGACLLGGAAVLFAVRVKNQAEEQLAEPKMGHIEAEQKREIEELIVGVVQEEQPDNKEEEKAQPKVEEMAIVELPSGLKYKITQKGVEGCTMPTRGQQITVHYTGYLAQENDQNEPDTNKKFDSSVDRGAPFKFVVGVGQVIKGWDEGLMLMISGEKRRLIIPAELGYGARGIPGAIPGGATLIFDVELF